ncbi:cell wall hydrolase [Aurantimonas sp. A2-1-M11]|uniref:cell wall hydrolase n=1 Tax=Aurantimonas sp. A2-1-M11 TaxID=3113712 RepID=UPI002F95C955
MNMLSIRGRLPALSALVSLGVISGCVGAPEIEDVVTPLSYGPSQECLARAMFFESNRSSREGMLAVGTVVMNRVGSPSYPDSVCEVVAQPKQFAPGVMTREMGAGRELAMQTAHDVLSGTRHAAVGDAKFFHTAGLSFGYGNMHYKVIAGGNAFYQKISRDQRSAGFRMASQADLRKPQGAAAAIDEVREAAVEASPAPSAAPAGLATATAMAPREPAADAANPFLTLWQGLTEEPARNDSGKGARLRPAAETTPAPAADETASLDKWMLPLPGVQTATGDATAPSSVPAPDASR